MADDSRPIIDLTPINERVYDLLKERILECRYPPGAKIDLKALREELGVSPTPIKDALFRLAGEGLVEVNSRRGTYVRQVSEQDLREILHARMILEGGVVEMHAAEISERQLEELERACWEADPHGRHISYRQLVRADDRFHRLMVGLAGNRRLLETYSRLNAHLQILRFRFEEGEEDPEPLSDMSHQGIMDALRDRDPAAAKQAVQEHIRDTWELLASRWGGRQPGDISASGQA